MLVITKSKYIVVALIGVMSRDVGARSNLISLGLDQLIGLVPHLTDHAVSFLAKVLGQQDLLSCLDLSPLLGPFIEWPIQLQLHKCERTVSRLGEAATTWSACS